MEGKKADVFAEIARQGMNFEGKNLWVPQPPELPEQVLPYDLSDQNSAVYPKKRESQQELAEDLAQMRERFAPFLQDHAPTMLSHRKRYDLREMDYRLETREDQQDFLRVLSGVGEWQRVQIPQYWGPLGEQRAYYRTQFRLSEEDLNTCRPFLCFKAVDYRAHVFLNGTYLGSHEGFFAPFEFDFSRCAKAGENVLVVTVENDFITGDVGDKIYAATGLGYDDPAVGWHHCPPGFGICQNCFVELRPAVFLRDIFVRPLVSEKRAEVQFEVYNTEHSRRNLTYDISVYGQNFKESVFEHVPFQPVSTVECGRGDTLTIAQRIASGEYGAAFPLPTCFRINTFSYGFALENMRLWELETPYLYQIQIRILDEEGRELDCMKRHFGMRLFTQDTQSEPYKGMFYLNGRPVRLRGSNTMGNEQQCVFKKDFGQLMDDILLAKLCHMNFLRITQRPVEEEVYDMCDKMGMMTQCDLPLFGALRRNQFQEAVRQAGEMERLVRSHPCNIIDSYINEPFPNAKNQQQLSLTRPELEAFFEACTIAVHQQNPDRVIKPIDGDYDPPGPGMPDNHCYFMWYNGHGIDMGKLLKGYWMPVKPGWYYGCGEFGTEGLDPVCVMRKYYPEDWLPHSPEEESVWSPNQIVNSQTGSFHYFFYETPNTLDGWVDESQKYQAWATKLMAEAFRRDERMVSFAIHLFIDAFPSGWMKTIMDVERRPKPAYFAYRDALAPLMVSLRTDRFAYFSGEDVVLEPWICNDTMEQPVCDLQYQITNEAGSVVLSGRLRADLAKNAPKFQGHLRFPAPQVKGRGRFTGHAALILEDGTILSHTSLDFQVFAPLEKNLLPVVCVGNRGKAREIVQELGLPEANFIAESSCNFVEEMANGDQACVILIDNYDAYLSQKNRIDRAAENGARVVFIELGEGEYQIADAKVTVKMCSMMPLHFVSRDTGHRFIEGFRKDDFRYWYDKTLGYIAPLLEYTFISDEFIPVLTSGNTDQNGKWGKALAAAELPFGKGSLVVCQVKLAGNLEKNPIARRFVQNLFAK